MIPKYTDPRRGTGRTTRAAQHAIDLAGSGKIVFFCCDRDLWSKFVRPMLVNAARDRDPTIRQNLADVVLFTNYGGSVELRTLLFFEGVTSANHQRREELNRLNKIGVTVFDHHFIAEHMHTFDNALSLLHAYDHDNREIPALSSPAQARQWLCSLEVEFAWKPALGADLALMALKDAQDAEVRMVLLGAVDRWTRGDHNSKRKSDT